MARAKGKLFLSVALAAVAWATLPTAAWAQEADRMISLAIPAQPLSGALRQLAETTGLQLVYDTKITDGKTAPAISGTTTGRAALAQLLAGSGLDFQFSGDRTVVISASAGDGVRSIGVVNVEGVAGNMPFGEMTSPVNGINGSRDVEATEGTGSYTTGATSIATKVPTSIRETPQSVSVITSQRIADQNLISIKDVLDQMPGIASTPGPTGEEFNLYSRGFAVNTYSFDGGAPVSYAYGNRPVIDISEFDSVQLIRGADGLFGGYGDPGGMVSLVRKKPLDHDQLTYTQDIGSFDYFREEVDVTGPVTSNHKLRVRLVAAEQDRKFFYDVANGHKTSVYGVLEYDLTPTTLIDVGASYTRENNVPNQGGLPRYIDGSTIDFPISTCLCVPYAKDRARKTEIFTTISQKITDSISAKVNVVYGYQNVDDLYFRVSGNVVKDVSNAGFLSGYDSPNPQRQIAVDYTVNGAFRLFGKQDVFTIGGNYRYDNNDGGATYNYDGFNVPNIFNFDPNAYPEPPTPPAFFNAIRSRETSVGIYGNLRLELFKGFHVSTGLRYNSYSQDATNLYSFSPTPDVSPTLKDHSHSSPNISMTYDIFHNFTLYGSHENIYQPQQLTRGATVAFDPPPITGVNDEVGLKWQSSNKRLNGALSFYNIKQDGVLSFDDQTQTNQPLISDTRSRGVDLELTGQIAPQIQLSFSYSYNFNSYTTQAFPATLGLVVQPATSYAPRNLLKTWAIYRGERGDPFGRLIVGGGVTYKSSAFNAGQVCGVILTSVDQQCQQSDFINYAFMTKGYATLNLKVGYRLNDHIELAVDGTNITNEKAFSSNPFQDVTGYNFYIEPLTVMGSVHFTW